jgi:transcriptional regulator with XRE-family HTH domain
MTQKELDRVAVLALRRSGQITQTEAATRLGVSERQVRRLERRIAAGGSAALRSGHRGTAGNRRIAPELMTKALDLIREHYKGFGPTLAAEYLESRHGILVSKETLRQHMSAARLWRPKRGPEARIHALRERRPRFGELIQVDGSFHPWFEDRAPACCLIVFIDDATSCLTQLHFVDRECTFGYMQALYGHVSEYGLPMALYSDQHGIFRVNQGDSNYGRQSHFGLALSTLGIESICATSPQAKGRVERPNGTLQDRLLKALRVEGVSSIEDANAFIPEYVRRHNRCFAIAPTDPGDGHIAWHASAIELRRILSKRHPRKLSTSLNCQFRAQWLQVHLPESGHSLRGSSVTVVEHFDGSLELLWRGKALPYSTMQTPNKRPRYAGTKDIAAPTPRTKQKAPLRAPSNHPWKTTPLSIKPRVSGLKRAI